MLQTFTNTTDYNIILQLVCFLFKLYPNNKTILVDTSSLAPTVSPQKDLRGMHPPQTGSQD